MQVSVVPLPRERESYDPFTPSCLLTYGLLLAGIATVHGEFLALALPLVTYLLVGYLQAPEKIKLEATRHLSAERVSPNSNVDVTVTVTNLGSGPGRGSA